MKDLFEFQPVENVETKGQLVSKVFYKPKREIYLCYVVGAAFILLCKLPAVIIGLLFIGFALAVQFLVKDYKVMDIYSQGVLIYQTEDSEHAFFLNYDDVEQWTANSGKGSADAMWFKLNDGRQLYKNTFQANSAYWKINKIIPDKEAKAIKARQQREQGIGVKEAVTRFFRKHKR